MAGNSSEPLTLSVRDDGQGPALLLVHGLGGDHTVWNQVAAELSRDHRVLLPDLRGHGRSPAPPGSTFGFSEMEGDLLRLLDQRQVERVHWVGLSAGALLGLQFALDHPDRLASLTVLGAATHCDNHTRAIVDRLAEAYRTDGFDGYILRLLKDLVYPDWIDAHMEFADQLREQQRREQGRGVLEWSRAIRSFDLRGRLGRIKVPTLIIQAVDDQVIDAAHGRVLRQSIWGSELKLLAETGHLIPVERPAETSAAIREWVGRAHPSPASSPAHP